MYHQHTITITTITIILPSPLPAGWLSVPVTLLFSVYSMYFQPAPCLSLGWFDQVPAAAAAAAAAPC